MTAAGKVRSVLRADRTLPQSARRVGDWILSRPVPGRPGVFRGGQEPAAEALGMSVATVRRAEHALVAAGYLEVHERGIRQRRNSTFSLTFNRSNCTVENPPSTATRGAVENPPSTAQFERHISNTRSEHGEVATHERGGTSNAMKDGIDEDAPPRLRLVAGSPDLGGTALDRLVGRRCVCGGLRTGVGA